MKSPHIVPFRGKITRCLRESLNNHPSRVFWFTGLSGSGKSTLAHLVEEDLYRKGLRTYVFDGDNVRHGLCGDLSFSPEARAENLRRVAEMVRLFLDSGTLCLTAFISPLEDDRNKVRAIVGEQDFFEIYIKCPLEVCEKRDVKGLYALARAGRIKNYTGVSAPYEPPKAPAFTVETHKCKIEDCVASIVDFIRAKLENDEKS
jgi:adenylylsulfate kinase